MWRSRQPFLQTIICEPFERGEVFSQRAFLFLLIFRKLQYQAKTSYVLIKEELMLMPNQERIDSFLASFHKICYSLVSQT